MGELLPRLLGGDHRPGDEAQDEEEGGKGDHRVELQHHPSEALRFWSQTNPRTLVLDPSVCPHPPSSKDFSLQYLNFHGSLRGRQDTF